MRKDQYFKIPSANSTAVNGTKHFPAEFISPRKQWQIHSRIIDSCTKVLSTYINKNQLPFYLLRIILMLGKFQPANFKFVFSTGNGVWRKTDTNL